MSRIRWYHFYFLLALFDVAVILLSLQLHSRAVVSASELMEAASNLDEQTRWLELAQQRVFQFSAPCNELFRLGDHDAQRARFEVVKRNITSTLDGAANLHMPVELPAKEIDAMVASGDRVFATLQQLPETAGEGERRELLSSAGRFMSDLEEQQNEALIKLGIILGVNAEQRDRLLQEHERDLQERIDHVRYFIAALVLILVGMLWFGRRLQAHDRALKEQNRKLSEERRESLAALGELCSSVAHGIRNPLAAIRSSAQLTLELGTLDEASKSRLQDILDEGKRLGDRVTGLLSMARTSSEQFEVVDLGALVSKAVHELKPAVAARGVEVKSEITTEATFVRGDRHQLGQVVIELLSNALDHAKAGDAIQIACRRPSANGTAIIEVSDDGPGVPEGVRGHIFDLFFTTKPGGTGIGLATIKRYARLHGGDVSLVPSDRGARFLVTLPVAKEGSGSDPTSSHSAGEPSAH